jgi:hypothetical protein
MSPERLSFRFGPLERRGLLGPIRAGQAGLIATGVLVGVIVLDQSPSAGGALVALIAFVAAMLGSIARLGRRTADEWTPIVVGYALRRLTGQLRCCSRAPAAGALAHLPLRLPGSATVTPVPPDAPRSVRGVRIVAVDYRDGQIGAFSDLRGRRLTAVLACRVLAFSLLEPEAQERRLGRWGLVLAGAAGTAVRRIQWVERTAPAQGDELARWLHAERDPAVPLRGTAMIESYLELIGSTAKVTQEHEVLVAVQVDGRRVRDHRAHAVARALIEHTERIAQGLEAAEVSVLGALTAGQLARTLRTAFDPYARTELAELDAPDPRRDGLSESSAWPLGAHEGWDRYRSDGALHATYWIGAWPRVDVSPMFMDALLGRSSAVRAVAVTFEALPPERSTREVEAAVTADRADRELRVRFGQSETARQRQAQEATLRREAELAAGHAEVRLAGFITVSGRDAQELNLACSQVHEQAARARLELHRMYGQQADAFTFTLPLCRGLR